MAKRKFLLKVRRSRKLYLFPYLMILSVVSLLIYLLISGYKITTPTWIISFVFISSTTKFIELHRIKDWWGITETSLVQSLGILDKNVREVDFSSISDLDLDQPFFKRILNYGNVNVRLFLNETTICIKDINNPEKFIEDFQAIIAKRRGGQNAIRQSSY